METQKTELETLVEKWSPVLDHDAVAPITDKYKKQCTARLLENTAKSWKEERGILAEADVNVTANVQNLDPVLISMIRRSMPNVIAYDIAGVQPMTMPTGLVFAMRARYADNADLTLATEAMFNEPDTDYSGTGAHAASDPLDTAGAAAAGFTTGSGKTTSAGEASSLGSTMKEMGFTVEKISATAVERGLGASYTTELAQDLRAVHGMDADAELSNILSMEIINELNREILRKIYVNAKLGATNCAGSDGTHALFNCDVDSNGRWVVERFKGLMFQINLDANKIGVETRRGRGNFVVVSPNVASALAMTGQLEINPAKITPGTVDPTGDLYVGLMQGNIKVFVDPFLSADLALVGYKGISPMDAGAFHCPYVPLTQYRAVDPATFQPRMAFKWRGVSAIANPFGLASGQTIATAHVNTYYRIFAISNLT